MGNIKHLNRILIAPLDWGLGHATRCVPIINQLIDQGITPVIAAYGAPLKFFKLEFPNLELIEFTGLQIKYPTKYSLMLKMAITFPAIVWSFIKEHNQLKKIIAKHNIDAVISDGRYGLWNRNVNTIFVNHQINIKLPSIFSIFEFPLYVLNRIAMSKYDEVWVPDILEKPNLAGNLSAKYKLSNRYKFIGPLSRFLGTTQVNPSRSYDVIILLSGPEPQRTIFENKLFIQLQNITNKNILVLRGKPDENKNFNEFPANIKIKNHLSTEEMEIAITNAELIISRPGYSTIMDLSMFGKKAIFVPTPGQSEQEYLAEYFKDIGCAAFYKQNEFELEKALKNFDDYKGIPAINNKFRLYSLLLK